MVGEEPRVDLDGRAVDWERRGVGRDDAGVRAAHAVVGAVERISEVVGAQQIQMVREHRDGGEPSGGAQV